MPVFNSEKFLKESIDSILVQSFDNYRLLILNDGSTDLSKEIIMSYNDNRINYYENDKNLGYSRALNYLISLSNRKYIARMDADDISFQDRLKHQLHFLENNPEIFLCGTWFKIFGDTEKTIKYPINHSEIKVMLLSTCCIAHPSVMFRNQRGVEYNVDFEPAEDYNLWNNLCKSKLLANLPEVLLHYRSHDNQVSNQRFLEQRDNANKTRLDVFHDFYPDATHSEKELFLSLMTCYVNKDLLYDRLIVKQFCNKIIQINYNNRYFDNYIFEKYVNNWLSNLVNKYGI